MVSLSMRVLHTSKEENRKQKTEIKAGELLCVVSRCSWRTADGDTGRWTKGYKGRCTTSGGHTLLEETLLLCARHRINLVGSAVMNTQGLFPGAK